MLPESPRFLMYKDRTVDSFRVWKLIRDMSSDEARAEFFVMKESVQLEMRENAARGVGTRWVFFDFITYVDSILWHNRYVLNLSTAFLEPAAHSCSPTS